MRVTLLRLATALMVFAASSAAAQAVAAPEDPTVTFAVTPLLDGPCTRLTGEPPDTAAGRELRARIDEFRARRAAEGPALLRAATEATGRPFAFRETMAAMHLCPVLTNMSLPLLVSMRRYLRAAPAGELADSLHRFSAVVFHEVLHRHRPFGFSAGRFAAELGRWADTHTGGGTCAGLYLA